MPNIFQGPRPDLTPAQTTGIVVVGVPILSNLARAFGVIDLDAEQEKALGETLQWGAVSAGLLFVSDAGLRAARGQAAAKVQAAALVPVLAPAQHEPGAPVEPPLGPAELLDDETRLDDELPIDDDLLAGIDLDLPTDEEEFADPPDQGARVVPEPPARPWWSLRR